MFKKATLLFGIIAILLLLPTAVFANVISGDLVINDALENSGFYTHTNKTGKTIRFVEIPTLSGITDSYHTSFGCLVYGNSYEGGRYLGETLMGEDYTNIEFNVEMSHTGDFEDQEWVERPWREFSDVRDLGFDGTPRYKTEIKLGIMMYLMQSKNPNEYKIKGELPETAEFWNNIEQRVHVLSPPSRYAWGLGRMWRVNPASSTGYSYMTIPIRPTGFDEKIGNLKAVSLELGVPAGEKALANGGYTATLVLENESDNSYTEAPVAILHGIWHATLYDELGNVLPKRVIKGQEMHVVNFNRKGTPGAIRTLTCEWHPFAQDIDGLTGIVNHEDIAVTYPETTYADNKIRAEAEVRKLVDIALRLVPIKEHYIISNLGQAAYPTVNSYLTYKTGDEFLAVDVTFDGPEGQKIMPIYLDPDDRGVESFRDRDGEIKPGVIGPGYSFVVTECGTYTINAEAWPRDIDDAYPEDNYDSVTITVGREAPIVIEEDLEPGIRAEQGGGGAR